MRAKNPIEEVEGIIKEFNKVAAKHTRPVWRRYPLLFAFLVTFGMAAILDGLKFILDDSKFFREHPVVLILIGIIILIFTGTLYKVLNKKE